MSGRVTFVGEVNPYHQDPRWALHPEPPYASGGQLCRILGIDPNTYLTLYSRLNLCRGEWSASAASDAAAEILNERPLALVLLGRKVERAFFGRRGGPGYFAAADVPESLTRALVLPHPSGLNRMWNEPGTVTRARRAFRRLLREVRR